MTPTDIAITDLMDHAATYGLACEIEKADDGIGFSVTMDTGEVEPATTIEDAYRIISAYGVIARRARQIEEDRANAARQYRVVNRFTGEVIANCQSYETAQIKADFNRPQNKPGDATRLLNPCQIQESYTITYADGTTAIAWRDAVR